MIRAQLQAGRGRWLGSISASALVFAALFFNWDAIVKSGINPLDAGQKIAFVAAAFAVTAYNLRTRVIDLVLKLEGAPNLVTQWCMIARGCGRKLTNLVVLFTGAALLLGAGGFLSAQLAASRIYGGITLGLFVASAVHFLYILFAFERLERFMLDDAEERARQKEAARLLK